MSNNMWSLIIWRSLTGLFAGSLILVQAYTSFISFHSSVLADLVSAEERSVYISRLDACGTAAFILGPALGGLLAQVNNHFPLYVGGIASGVALLVALFFLKESNPFVLQRRQAKKTGIASSFEDMEWLLVEKKVEEKPLKKVKVHITGTMVLCFCFEFCLRWTVGTFESRYGIYLTDMFNTPSLLFSYVWQVLMSFSGFIILQSVVCCLYQSFVYPWFTGKLKVPIPYLAIAGMIIQFFSYLCMTLNNQFVSMVASLFLWLGFNNAGPTSVSIISVSAREYCQN